MALSRMIFLSNSSLLPFDDDVVRDDDSSPVCCTHKEITKENVINSFQVVQNKLMYFNADEKSVWVAPANRKPGNGFDEGH